MVAYGHMGEAVLYYWDVYRNGWVLIENVGDNQGGVGGCAIRIAPGSLNDNQYEDQDYALHGPDIPIGHVRFHAAMAPGDENTADVLWVKAKYWR